MAPSDLCRLTIADLSELLAQHELSPVDVVQAHLAQIERLESRLNCFITLCGEAALAAARAAGAAGRSGAAGGGADASLLGIPVAVKDNVETAGVRSTAGSRVLAEYVPAEDAPAWGRLRRAGAILLGKTNLHEFGMGATTLNPHYGHTRNPWDTARVPGGSSGGSAAAVAAGMAPAALGTDAGGSVRIPAALCGVVGLKPTHGLVPVRGGIGFGNPTVDHIGPLTRAVADAALLLSLMAGVDPRDPTTQAAPRAADYLAGARRGAAAPDLRGVRVGVPRDHYFEACHPEVEAAVRAAVAHLERLGASAAPVALPDHAALVAGLSGLGAEGLVYHGPWMRARLGEYSEPVQARLLANQFILAADYARALRAPACCGSATTPPSGR